MNKISIKQRFFLGVISCFAFALVVGLFWQGLHGPFFLDDSQTITPTQLSHFSWSKFFEITLQNDTGPLGRPISVATFALNNYFFGNEPFSLLKIARGKNRNKLAPMNNNACGFLVSNRILPRRYVFNPIKVKR